MNHGHGRRAPWRHLFQLGKHQIDWEKVLRRLWGCLPGGEMDGEVSRMVRFQSELEEEDNEQYCVFVKLNGKKQR